VNKPTDTPARRGKQARRLSLKELKAERWRETKCQIVARQFSKWFSDRGVSTVFVDDLTDIRDQNPARLGAVIYNRIQEWPYYQLQTRLISCLEEAGITAIRNEVKDISRICPECSHKNEATTVYRDRLFKCERCGYTRHIDVVAAINNMKRGCARLRDDTDAAAKQLTGTELEVLSNRFTVLSI
jgi:transposase